MISKSQLKQILFIKSHIKEKDLFIRELFLQIELYLDNKISKDQFIRWIDSWEATAELDLDPKATARIKRALKEIRSGKTQNNGWAEFKHSIGIS
jgi:hypothetical protein